MPYSFFLGANSARGFHSFYDELIDLKEAKAVYILKGCPGCGKSSLMKKVAAAAEKNSFDVEYIHCSSDPSSLDGIIIPKLRTAIVDGTSPHVVEPTYPLAVDRYIDLGIFADTQALHSIKDKIIKTKEKHTSFFKHIYRFTLCAGAIDNELFDISVSSSVIEKLHKKAHGIITKELPKRSGNAKSKRRFLSAVSPDGYVTLPINDNLRTYVIEDDFGLGHFLLSPINQAAEYRGYSCIACFNPLIPERLEHLFIPELNLAFISKAKKEDEIEASIKKIKIDPMLDFSKETKKRINTLRRAKSNMLDLSSSLLKEAKLIHDELENLYNPHIDFDSLYEFTEKLSVEILK